MHWLNVEWGLLLEGSFLIAGLACSTYLVVIWSGEGIPEPDHGQKVRSVIPVITLLVVGLKIYANSFLSKALQFMLETLLTRRHRG
jgi:hypothetical protein